MKCALYTMLCLVLTLIVSCSSKDKEQRDIVAEWIGKELIIPDSLQAQIGDTPIDYDFNDADFKIVTYIDSTGCTGCKMKLKEWDSFIDKLKLKSDISLNFIMIISHNNESFVKEIINNNQFLHPYSIEKNNSFFTINKLSKSRKLNTFLLDRENKIIALGNPIVNPKIATIYEKFILEDLITNTDEISQNFISADEISRCLGVVNSGDKVINTFCISNESNSILSLEKIIPSCSCVKGNIQKVKVDSGEIVNVQMDYVADTIKGSFYQYIDLYFKEKLNPFRLIVYGFIN